VITPVLAEIAGVSTGTFVFAAIIIAIALVFDFTNGMHDAANSIATIVSTRVLSPRSAVIFAAFFNFAAFFWGNEAVAKTVGSGMINVLAVAEEYRLVVLLCGLLGAITWNMITWYYGIPSSSSHALVGGYAGAAVAAAGFSTIVAAGWTKTLIFIVLSPLVGLTFGFLIMVAVMWIFRWWSPSRVDNFFRKGQIVSSALISFSHGGNDAQKTMGIIAGVLVASGIAPGASQNIPWWVSLPCYVTIALGTMSGGWRIVHTMGSKITKLKPVGGFAAETGAAAAITIATHFGIPVSTTHTITGAIMGVGATRRLSAVRWGLAGNIVWAWIITIPASAAVAAVCFLIAHLFV
jgi:inorganic phosphate transporter, PiT family